MSGGGAGPIILKSAAQAPGVDPVDHDTLILIADKSPVSCSFTDAIKAIRIIWKYLRP